MKSSRDVIRVLKSKGWVEVSTRGSHVKFRHPDFSDHVIVVHPRKDFPIGTLRAIAASAGLKISDF